MHTLQSFVADKKKRNPFQLPVLQVQHVLPQADNNKEIVNVKQESILFLNSSENLQL